MSGDSLSSSLSDKPKRRGCGVPNRDPPSSNIVYHKGNLNGLRGLSWNCKALMTKDVTKLRKKMTFLARQVPFVDIGCLQETHGTHELVKLELGNVSNEFIWKHSMGESSSAGGVITLLRKSMLKGANIEHEELIPGRTMRTKIIWGALQQASLPDQGWIRANASNTCMLIIYNCHVWWLSTQQHRQITSYIIRDKEHVIGDPFGLYCLSKETLIVWLLAIMPTCWTLCSIL